MVPWVTHSCYIEGNQGQQKQSRGCERDGHAEGTVEFYIVHGEVDAFEDNYTGLFVGILFFEYSGAATITKRYVRECMQHKHQMPNQDDGKLFGGGPAVYCYAHCTFNISDFRK